MKRIVWMTLFLALVCGCLALARAQERHESHESQESFASGLGELMLTMQQHHAKTYYAATAANWELADYELGEIKECLEDAAKFHPKFEKVNVKLAELVPALTDAPVKKVGEAIKARDKKSFVGAFRELSNACNRCHSATEHGFIVIQPPTAPAFSNQKFSTKNFSK